MAFSESPKVMSHLAPESPLPKSSRGDSTISSGSMASETASIHSLDEHISRTSSQEELAGEVDSYPMDLVSVSTPAHHPGRVSGLSMTGASESTLGNIEGLSSCGVIKEPRLASKETLDDIETIHNSVAATPQRVVHDLPVKEGTNGSPYTEFEHIEPEEPDKSHKCDCCRLCCFRCCRPCLTSQNPLPSNPSRTAQLRYAFMCPPHGKLARLITLILALLFFWGVVWSLTGAHALPGGNFFGLIILVVCCLIGGALVAKIHLPPLLGMLLVGVMLRNVPVINVAKDIDPVWSAALRNVALVVILIRAGLGLDPVALRKLSGGVLRLAFIPCLVEACTAAVASHFLLGFPWDWGFMLGFVLAAVSPAVVVPSLLALQEKGYGVSKGIPTLVIAAASMDDVLAISGFGIVLGITFAEGSLAVSIVKGPLEAVAGIVYGVLFGIIAWYFPHKKHEQRTFYRFIILFCGGLFATFGSRVADISGAGPLGCLTMAFVAALGWRKELDEGQDPPVNPIMANLWLLFQPLLFGLIGAEIDVAEIQAKTVGLGIAVLCIGLTLRIGASFLSVFGLGFTLKEKLFIPIAWLPKATVQAAIGSVALDTARAKNSPAEEIELGVQLLTIAVLVILITAPIGAAAISLSAPRLLSKTIDKGQSSSESPNGLMMDPQQQQDSNHSTEDTAHMI